MRLKISKIKQQKRTNLRGLKKKDLSTKSENKPNNISKKSTKINGNIYDVVDVCTIIEKCSIEEISKYLINQGRKKDYPDITIKEKKL